MGDDPAAVEAGVVESLKDLLGLTFDSLLFAREIRSSVAGSAPCANSSKLIEQPDRLT